MTWHIRAERPEDEPLVEMLLAEAFGPGRFAKTAFRLREGVEPEAGLSFVAVEDRILRGSVRFWPVAVDGARVLLLGPLAVQGHQRGRGIGIDLMQHGIEEAKAKGWDAIILVGDEPYYSRVGFTPVKRGALRLPGPVDRSRLLGLALTDGALERLSGDVRRARIDIAVCPDSAAVG